MSEGASMLSIPVDVPTDAVTALLEKGKRQGSVTPDELFDALQLKDVDLRVEHFELIERLKARLADLDIDYDEVNEEELADDEALATVPIPEPLVAAAPVVAPQPPAPVQAAPPA